MVLAIVELSKKIKILSNWRQIENWEEATVISEVIGVMLLQKMQAMIAFFAILIQFSNHFFFTIRKQNDDERIN
jgi:hypothetical protein